MGDNSNLYLWGALAGLIAGIALHVRTRGAWRASTVRFCLGFGILAIVFYGLVTVTGVSSRKLTKGASGVLLVGYPTLVAGIVMAALEGIRKRALRRGRKPPGV